MFHLSVSHVVQLYVILIITKLGSVIWRVSLSRSRLNMRRIIGATCICRYELCLFWCVDVGHCGISFVAFFKHQSTLSREILDGRHFCVWFYVRQNGIHSRFPSPNVRVFELFLLLVGLSRLTNKNIGLSLTIFIHRY